MSRNQTEILLAVALVLFVLVLSPGAAITGPVALIALILSAVVLRRRQRARGVRRR